MKKTLFVTHSAKPAGAELALLRLASVMDKGDVTVMFMADGEVIDLFRQNGIAVEIADGTARASTVPRAGTNVAGFIAATIALVRSGWATGRYIESTGHRIVVANSVKSLVFGAVACRRARVPLVWAVHDRVSPDYLGRLISVAVRVLGRWTPDGYIVNSRSTQDTLWTGSKPVLLAPPGVEIDDAPEPSAVRTGVENITMVGRLSPWKGQAQFLDAFAANFADGTVEAVLIGGALFGEEDYEAGLHRQAHTLGIADRVTFTGHVDNVRDHLRRADMMVHCSIIPEPFGTVVIEGLTAGCAVIATKPGGPSEVITHGVDGLLVDCGDVDALTGAIRRLADDVDLRSKFRITGPKRAAQFDVRSIAASVSAWLEKL